METANQRIERELVEMCKEQALDLLKDASGNWELARAEFKAGRDDDLETGLELAERGLMAAALNFAQVWERHR